MRAAKGSKLRSGWGSTCGLDRQADDRQATTQPSPQTACFDKECQDILDWSLCGYLSNIGQCALMNTLATFDVPVPCEATCGSCKLNLTLRN